MTPDSWFGASILLESVHARGDGEERLFEQRVIVVRADDLQHAHEKAAKFGDEARERYLNQYGEPVEWVFREVLDVVALYDSTIEDGTEVFSRLVGEEELSVLRGQPGSVAEQPG